MLNDIEDGAADIIRRLSQVDRATGLVDHGRVEDALQRHLIALGVAARPIQWVTEAERGHEASASELLSNDPEYSIAFCKARTISMSVALNQAQLASWSAAEVAAWRAGSKVSIVYNLFRIGAITAAYCGTLDRTDVWLPFVDAFEAGLWAYHVTPTKIIVIPRPAMIIVQDRLHCETGPAVTWPNGATYWFWRGTQVPQEIIEEPETLTIRKIDKERNAEIRRVMIERFGTERYIREGFRQLIGSDPVHGDLYRKRRKGDTDIVMLHVRNNTTEPDGTVREFWIRVHPECRPFRARDKWVGDPQRMTPLNARASTWGLTGEVFKNLAEAS